jgi:MerR family transcriptional regulator, heat shock protein HspR
MTRRTRKSRATERYMTISTVCQVFRLDPRTLSRYERRGLIEGEVMILEDGREMMAYNDRDLRRIRRICSLTRELGVNMSGIEVILQLLDRLERRV